MKKIANRLAIAITSFAILFAGCSNSIDGSVDSLKYSVLASALSGGSSRSNVKTLNIAATTNDKLITFDGSSRTITPDQIDATTLKFYLWGINDSNQTNVDVKEVQFNVGATKFEGTVPVQLDVSDYKLYLAAVPSAVAAGISLTGTYATDVAAVRSKSILYANANVDLRYSQNVKFYLSPFNLSGTSGDITLTLKTYDFKDDGTNAKDYWFDTNYYVAVSLQNPADGSVVNVQPEATGTGSYVVSLTNDKLPVNSVAVADGTGSFSVSGGALSVPSPITGWGDLAGPAGITYKLSAVPTGTYNLVVKFVGKDKNFYYTDKVVVLANRDITETVEIPKVIGKKPKPVSNLKVGYNDPDNADGDYYLATFQWSDNSNNEEYFVLQLVDVSNDKDGWQEDGTVLGLAADAKAALAGVAGAPGTITSSSYAADFAAVKSAWDAEVTSAKLTAGKVKGMSLDKNVFQQTESLYAAGSLDKNSTTVSIFLPLGSVYMARICAFNQECESLGSTDDAILVSDQEWLYANTDSLESAAVGTIDKLPSVYLATSASTGYVADGYTPSLWPKKAAAVTKEEEDDPIAINRYRLTYNLNGGRFWKLQDENGRLVSIYDNETNGRSKKAFEDDTDVTASIEGITGISSELTTIVEYHTATAIGTDLISPVAYCYDATNYATLFKNPNNVWTGWKKDYISGTLMEDGSHVFRDIKWTKVKKTGGTPLPSPETVGETERTYEITDTTFAAATVAADPSYYIASVYGYIRTAGCGGDTKDPLSASSTFENVSVKSADRSIVIRSSLPNYVTFGNLNLIAEYTASFARLSIYSPANYDLSTANIRVMKSSDNGTNYVTANVSGTPSAPVDGTYTDFELDGTSFLISPFYGKLRFKVLDFKEIYKLAKLEISLNGSTAVASQEVTVDSTKFVVNDTLVGSGTDNKDPIVTTGKTSVDQFVFDVNVASLKPGKYTAKIYAYTTVNEKTGFTYPVTFEVADPTYTAYTACTVGDAHTELFETTDPSDTSKYYRSRFTSYDDAAANGVTVYYGSTAAY